MKLNLTKGEAHALLATADQMKDDLEYYRFLGKAKYKKFLSDYETGMNKLKKAMQGKEVSKSVE